VNAELEAEFQEMILSMFSPVPDEPVWQWAERSVAFTATESEVTGMFSTDLTPYIRKILEFFRSPTAKTLTIMAGTQVLKSVVLMIGAAYWIDHHEGRLLWVMDSNDNARSFSKSRWKGLLENSPGIKHLVPRHVDDFGNSEQYLGGVILNFTGSNSAGNLSQRGADLLLLDEVDKFPDATEEEGDAVTQADQRKKARGRSKKVQVSSPTTTSGLIWKGYQGGTMEEWHCPCPHCGGKFVFETGNEECHTGRLVWDQTAKGESGEWGYEAVRSSARYECPHCKALLDDGEKVEAVAAGDWVAMNPNPEPDHWSFHLSSFNSPWASCRLGELAAEWLKLKKKFDLRSWDKYWRGWPSEDKVKKPEAVRLAMRREHWQGDPKGAVLYTIGVDTQDDRLEAQLVGWGAGLENWCCEYAVFHGNPGHAGVWNELGLWLVDTCARRRVTGIGLDTGGHFTDEAYLFVQKWQSRVPVYAMKGANVESRAIINRPSRVKSLGIKLYMVGSDTAKERIYSMLTILEKGAGYCHFRDTLDDQYFEGLVSEDVELRWKNGKQVRRWVKNTERNEPLDTRVYALAALHIRGLREITREKGQQQLALDKAPDADPDLESSGEETNPTSAPQRMTPKPRAAPTRRTRGPGRGFGI
jgi:phage terminase large subunit GpA-like protein